MQPLEEAVDAAAERTGFSGVVRVDRGDELELAKAYGFADRAHAIPNTVETLFATASGDEGPDGAGGHEPGRATARSSSARPPARCSATTCP